MDHADHAGGGRPAGAAVTLAVAMFALALASGPGAAQEGALVAEPQVPSGKFTTATEVRPILEATRANWVALREYDGADFLYLTHLLSWRCGLAAVRVSLNGGAAQDWPLPPCDAEAATPNAIPEDAQIYTRHELGSIERVEVEVVYDDLATARAVFERAAVLMP